MCKKGDKWEKKQEALAKKTIKQTLILYQMVPPNASDTQKQLQFHVFYCTVGSNSTQFVEHTNLNHFQLLEVPPGYTMTGEEERVGGRGGFSTCTLHPITVFQ